MSASAYPLSDGERLQRFASLTDAALAYLGADELLAELLDRLQETLEVDGAAVLLMDESRSHLMSAMARGPAEVALQDARVRIGEGLAGAVAVAGDVLTLDELDHDHRGDPTVRDGGFASAVCVPLVAQGTTIGVLQVGSLTPRQFTADDIHLLRSTADRMAVAVDARSSDAQLSATILLQRSLVPARLPPVAGLSTAARYVPGEGGTVGGDWYDLFTLPSGHVAFAVGDVVGHGLQAAVVMGRLRSALRAYALGSLDPAEVITQLDRKLRHFERSQMATLLYGILDPMLDRMRLSSAGHPPPMLAGPGMPAGAADVPPDPPLGASFRAPRRTTTIDLVSGGMLCLYTDGLIERRGEHLDVGLARLGSALTAGEPEGVCDAVMAALVGRTQPEDDVAVLVIRRDEVRGRNVLVLPAERPALARIRTALRRWLAPADASDHAVNDLLVAVCEAAANCVEHAYGPAGGLVEVAVEVDDGEVVATIRDNGRWRSPRGHGRGRGRGTLLMEGLSDEVRIDRAATGTEVTIRRRLRREDDP